MAKRPRIGFTALGLAVLVGYLALGLPRQGGTGRALALVGGTVYVDPSEEPIRAGVVLVENGMVKAVGRVGITSIPQGIEIIDCSGMTVVPGFWNSHVHFTDSQWDNAAALPAERLSQQLEAMLTRWGFTTVFDTGSLLSNTLTLRRRIEAGEVRGPRILTSGEPFVSRSGTPYYLRPIELPELLNPAQASSAARERLRAGADAVKLHAGAIVDRERDVRAAIPVELIRAVADEVERQNKVLLAHPQYLDGLRNSINGGVDVLLHVTELVDAWPKDLLVRAVERDVALVPTLKMLAPRTSARRPRLLGQVRDYVQAGGTILFGTDAGFIPDYDPSDEYTSLGEAGMTYRQILASLTTAPARRFDSSNSAGRIAPGVPADIVILSSDPANDVRALSDIRYTVRRGHILYRSRP
jgi:imidazolonepropionase-like amidohydrolase